MNKNTCVVHISTVHSCQDPRIFYKQCTSLAKNGMEVHLITPDGLNKKINEVQVHSLRYKSQNRLSRLLFASKQIFDQALELHPDIIHFHDPELIPRALKVQNHFSGQIIYDIHEDNTTAIAHREYLNNLVRPLLISLINYYEQRASNDLNTIIAEKYYEQRFPKAKPILNYPKLDWMTENKDAEIYNGLLYTGNVREERGAINHSKILRELDDVEVWHIGRCEPNLYERMQENAGKNSKHLIVKGISEYILFDVIVEYYKSRNWLAGLAIFPYSDHVSEKQLTKFFEYMAAGIPIIYSNFPAWIELLEPLDVGFSVDPENETEIVDAINKLKANPKLHDAMGKNGQKKVKQMFTWEQEEKKLLKFYESISN